MTMPPEPPAAPPPASSTTSITIPGTLPMPGNAEILFLLLAAIALAVLAWVADGITDRDWWTTATVFGAAYIISRGVAKASRVFEQ